MSPAAAPCLADDHRPPQGNRPDPSAEAYSRRDTSYHHNNFPVAHDETLEAVEASSEATRVRAAR